MAPQPPWQFSLRSLMIAVTLLAIALGLSVTVGSYLLAFTMTALFWFAIPTVLVSCATYARGDVQAFAIGGLVPVAIALLGNGTASQNPIYVYLCSALCGVIAVAVRRWNERFRSW